MEPLYVYKGKRRLRRGFTTGTCAALAARAATLCLLGESSVSPQKILTPKGVLVSTDILYLTKGENFARCAVQKDAGDDPDATDGLLIYARVEKIPGEATELAGGEGVGIVTKPGLSLPVGECAINPGPRAQILRAVRDACEEKSFAGGLRVTISAPGGEKIARKTFNGRLGIEGGISILGTSGIVEPMSEEALIETIRLEMKRVRLESENLVLVPGNYGEDYVSAHFPAFLPFTVKCSNFVGEAIDAAAVLGFSRLLFIAHIGKGVKVAGGIMNTHSSVADTRMEILTAHAARSGADKSVAETLMESPTADAGVEVLKEAGLLEDVMKSVSERLRLHLSRRAGEGMCAEGILFSRVYGTLCGTKGADSMIERFGRGN